MAMASPNPEATFRLVAALTRAILEFRGAQESTIASLFDAWRELLAAQDGLPDGDGADALGARMWQMEQEIAATPALTVEDWQRKVAVASYCNPGGDGPAHLAVATEALTAVGMADFLPQRVV